MHGVAIKDYLHRTLKISMQRSGYSRAGRSRTLVSLHTEDRRNRDSHEEGGIPPGEIL